MEKAPTKDNRSHHDRWPLAAKIVGGAGGIVTLLTAGILKIEVSEKLNEGISGWANNKWANQAAGAVLDGIANPDPYITEPNELRILRVIDPKQWRSNIVFWGTLVAGFLATGEIVKQLFPSVRKIEDEHWEEVKQRHAARHTPPEKSWSKQIEQERSVPMGVER